MREKITRRKKISIMIPCFNEVDNVGPMSEAVVKIMTEDLPQYDYELVFIDNDSSFTLLSSCFIFVPVILGISFLSSVFIFIFNIN